MIEKIKLFAEDCLKDKGIMHGIKHAESTAAIARQLAIKENLDAELCEIAGLLHDIGRRDTDYEETPEDNHGIIGSEKARVFLLTLLPQDRVDIICKAISEHCFPDIQTTEISKILWDADKINLFKKENFSAYLQFWQSKGLTEEQAKEKIEKEKQFYGKTFYTDAAKRIILQ
jgi:uncharacterized protein